MLSVRSAIRPLLFVVNPSTGSTYLFNIKVFHRGTIVRINDKRLRERATLLRRVDNVNGRRIKINLRVSTPIILRRATMTFRGVN